MRVRRIAIGMLAAAALLAVVPGVPAASDARGLTGSETFTDPAGDAELAPDLTTVRVENDDSGRLTFAVTFSNRPDPLNAGDQVSVFLDTDLNAATGDPLGADYALLALGRAGTDAAGLCRLGGGETDCGIPQPTFGGTTGPSTLTLFVNRSDLGGTDAFTIRVSSSFQAAGGGTISYDFAPDAGQAAWMYRLVIGTSPPPPPPPPPAPPPPPPPPPPQPPPPPPPQPPPPPPPQPPAPRPARCVVPSVKGKTLPVAVRALTRARCRVGAVSRVYSVRVKKGRVLSQSRRAGIRLPARSRVSLVVSRGPR